MLPTIELAHPNYPTAQYQSWIEGPILTWGGSAGYLGGVPIPEKILLQHLDTWIKRKEATGDGGVPQPTALRYGAHRFRTYHNTTVWMGHMFYDGRSSNEYDHPYILPSLLHRSTDRIAGTRSAYMLVPCGDIYCNTMAPPTSHLVCT